jgi:amino acid adenylation domain-containing protein
MSLPSEVTVPPSCFDDVGDIRPTSSVEPSLVDCFERCASQHASKTAIASKDLSLTYEALNGIANRLAWSILATCPPEAGHVALLFDQGTMAMAAMLGALKAGKTYVPLDPSYPAARTTYILEDSESCLILTDHRNLALARQLAGSRCRVLNIEELGRGPSDAHPALTVAPDAIAYILYTSGSTGQPKGVMQTQRNLLHFIRSYTGNLGITAADRLTLFYSFSFSASLMDIYGSLLTGATVFPYNVKAEGVALLHEWLQEKQITVYHSVPTVLRHLMESLPAGCELPHLRVFVLGGEPVYQRDVELFRKHFGPRCVLVNHLAFTEASVSAQFFMRHDTEVNGLHAPAGFPASGVDILFVDEHGQEVPDGEVGELIVKSRFLSPGYWRKPELTQAVFASSVPGGPRLFRTGDIGRRTAQGLIEHLGRKDARLKIRGHSVEVIEIEMALLQLTTIREAAVVAQPGRLDEPQLVAYCVPRRGALPSVRELRKALGTSLPDYMIPARFVALAALPLTPTGKLDRRALSAHPSAKTGPDRPYAAPEHVLEALLARIWEEVLLTRPVGITDDFFELGGDSLQAADMFVCIQRKLGKAFPFSMLVENRTIARLALAIRRDSAATQRSCLVTIQAGGAKPPLFCVHCGKGSVFHYYDLARLLDPDQPVYGLQPRGMASAEPFDRRVEDMAARYLHEILACQRSGPYFLCGYSFGGIVAFELAQQLLRRGHEVAFVGLLDTTLPNSLRPAAAVNGHSGSPSLDEAPRVAKSLWRSVWGNLHTLFSRTTSYWKDFPKIVRGKAARALGHPVPLVLQDVYYFREISRPSRAAYLPRNYPGPVTLFRAGGQLPPPGFGNDLGWGAYADGGVVIDELPGVHLDLLREPTVALLADKLKVRLRAARAGSANQPA